MAAGKTYEAIATASPTSGTSYTFSSIPQTYTDLVLVGSCIMSGGTTLRLQVNGASSGYTYQIMRSDGSITKSNSSSMIELCDNTATALSTFVINITDYTTATLPNKVIFGQSGDSANSIFICGGYNVATNISSVTVLTTNGQTFASGSSLTLYGIARA
jgi:hypothetical protein